MKRKKSKPIALAQANDRLIKHGPSPMAKLVIGLEQTNGRVNQISGDVDLAVAKAAEFTTTIKSITDKLDRRLKKMENANPTTFDINTINNRISEMMSVHQRFADQVIPLFSGRISSEDMKASAIEFAKMKTDISTLSNKIELIASDSSDHLSNVTSSFQKLVADIEGRVSNMEKCIPQTCSPAPEVSRGRQLAGKFIDRCSIAPDLPVDKNAQGSFSVAFLENEIATIVDSERKRIIEHISKIREQGFPIQQVISDLKTGFDYRDDQ